MAFLSGLEPETLRKRGRHGYYCRDMMAAYLIDARNMLDPDEAEEPK